MKNNYDAVIVGAGSVGLTIAFFLTQAGMKVLVLEMAPTVGQGQHKTAIGGVRATHSDPAKILVCRESLNIFKGWEETYGSPVGWKGGGYCLPVYREKEKVTLQSLLPVQKKFGLNIDWTD
ncbi:MAG: FAD-binding oxidoreductase [Chitinispirillaceae bacterium]|nr:FAD-binding oxidoreductase [Chitinispirillaceae bacterium]